MRTFTANGLVFTQLAFRYWRAFGLRLASSSLALLFVAFAVFEEPVGKSNRNLERSSNLKALLKWTENEIVCELQIKIQSDLNTPSQQIHDILASLHICLNINLYSSEYLQQDQFYKYIESMKELLNINRQQSHLSKIQQQVKIVKLKYCSYHSHDVQRGPSQQMFDFHFYYSQFYQLLSYYF
ncbi:Hypothetical_protein [Hexamita inflata]|uniref:Hypothetical_protein n=1 Tax=Hexamita inflata TaxID=28002 RepID=A0AA86U1D1_9EUKA|nr:Hypothetical protein HINF_LOCUS15168 [Hexamita inflata]